MCELQKLPVDIDAFRVAEDSAKNQQVNGVLLWNARMCAFLRGFSFVFFTLTRVNAAFTGVNHSMGDVSPHYHVRSTSLAPPHSSGLPGLPPPLWNRHTPRIGTMLGQRTRIGGMAGTWKGQLNRSRIDRDKPSGSCGGPYLTVGTRMLQGVCTSVPELCLALIGSDAPASFVEVSNVVSCIIMSAFRGGEIPSKRLLRVSGHTLSPAKADA